VETPKPVVTVSPKVSVGDNQLEKENKQLLVQIKDMQQKVKELEQLKNPKIDNKQQTQMVFELKCNLILH
jgi:TolA-binding protein